MGLQLGAILGTALHLAWSLGTLALSGPALFLGLGLFLVVSLGTASVSPFIWWDLVSAVVSASILSLFMGSGYFLVESLGTASVFAWTLGTVLFLAEFLVSYGRTFELRVNF